MRAFFLVLAVMAAPLFGQEYSAGGITILDPMSHPTVARAGVGYMTLVNAGGADALVAVQATFPKVMIHKTVQAGGISKMIHQPSVPLPAGGTVHFAPGGLHVMFIGLSTPWSEGDKIAATLVFEKAGSVDVEFTVKPRTTATGMAHRSQ